ncbi:MAG: hypothetical protein LCH56_13120 [Proteobacteria bacterium]|nr:hypothetical protein [Pseudomonadota bacterium]
MTHHTRKLSELRTAGHAQTSTYRGFAAAAPTGIAAARASTTLALSMMVALRYLEGRASRPADASAHAIPDPTLS